MYVHILKRVERVQNIYSPYHISKLAQKSVCLWGEKKWVNEGRYTFKGNRSISVTILVCYNDEKYLVTNKN